MAEDGRYDGGPPPTAGDDDPSPADRLVEHLIEAREIAAALDQTMLRRLIEAVMLEAGRTFAGEAGDVFDGHRGRRRARS